ncbi:MAG TPA: NADH:ubiquinone reductase (Na(+)-transporting) subunit C [Bacteroidales bacterium]|nr:NADH:ubiquinone reductase (Na(+)-transporting) subunit C [Bacteroidales bacterium]
MFSNAYIFRFASIMVIITATLLSAAAVLLKPFQDRNIAIEKMQAILSASNIPSNRQNAIELYNKYVVRELTINLRGEIVGIHSHVENVKTEPRAFNINIRQMLRDIEDYRANLTEHEPLLPVFVVNRNGITEYVFPLLGRGLWGPVWGNIALATDLNTIIGVSFDHRAETPGLGAEISTQEFEQQFIGKKIFDHQGNFVSVQILRGGVATGYHQVDALSGGTITCNGVSQMLQTGLENYIPFFQKHREL